MSARESSRRLGRLGAAALLAMLAACAQPVDEGPAPAARAARKPTEATSAAGQPDPTAALERLAGGVRNYGAKARLIRLGPVALPYLLEQAAGSDEELAAESISAIRWMVQKWKDDSEGGAGLATDLARYTEQPEPAERREFAVDLLGDLGGEVAIARLTELLEDGDLATPAALALGRVAGPEARLALTDSLAGATPERRALIYSILGRRGEPESIPLLTEAAASDDAAVTALAGFDDPAVTAWLLEATRDGSQTALEAILATDAAAHDGRMLAQIARAARSASARETVAARVNSPDQFDPDLVEALIEMPTNGAIGRARSKALLNLAEDMDPAAAAAVAREALARFRQATVVVPALNVCAVVCPPAAAAEIGKLLDSSNSTIRLAAVRALARLDGEAASTELHEAILDADAATARPMLRALSERRDDAAALALLDLMEAPNEALEAALLRSALAMAPELENRRQAAQIWARSLDLSLTTEAIEGLGEVGAAGQLRRLEAVLAGSGGELYEAAREAVVGIGRRLARDGSTNAAIAALNVAFEHGAPVGGDLRRLGERVELVAHGGRIDAWWRLPGAPDAARCQSTEPPTAALEALDEPDSGPQRWRPIEAAGTRGTVELGGAAQESETPLWLAADLVPRSEVRVGLVVRSTPDVVAWLNGQKLEPQPGEAGDGDRYAATLGEGDNRILLRLCAVEPGATLTVRLEDESGRPLKFRIR